MNKRTVFIDMRYLSYLTNGFGQLCLHYGQYFLENPHQYKDLDITLLVPKEFIGKFGNNVKYLQVRKIYKFIPFLLPNFDIVHSLTQQIKFTPLSNTTFRILTIHDLNYMYQRSNARKIKQKHQQTQARINLANLITVISNFTAQDLKKHFDLTRIPIRVNHNGMRDIRNDKANKPVFIKSEKKFLFTVGEIVPKKNFHVLLDMIKLMPEYDLYICGNKATKYGEMIDKRIKEENITNAYLTGKISHEEKVWMYKECRAFVFPSLFEGFGMPVIEAMSFKKPVFSSQMTSLTEIGDRFAYFWDNFEPEHMKNIIVSNIDLFYGDASLGKAEVSYALSYSISDHMNRFLDMYREVELCTKFSLSDTIRNYLTFLKA